MPRFAANLSMLYNEHAFLDRFAAAAADGFQGVEYLFPYEFPAAEIARRLQDNGLAQVLFPGRANGSLVVREGQVRGSELIGQSFHDARYFWSRPSATTPGYNAAASGGSNLGPLNPTLLEAINARVAALRAADPQNDQPIPVDLVTASASGLDPHISVAAARYQLARVAR